MISYRIWLNWLYNCREICSWSGPRMYQFSWFGCLEERIEFTVCLLSLRQIQYTHAVKHSQWALTEKVASRCCRCCSTMTRHHEVKRNRKFNIGTAGVLFMFPLLHCYKFQVSMLHSDLGLRANFCVKWSQSSIQMPTPHPPEKKKKEEKENSQTNPGEFLYLYALKNRLLLLLLFFTYFVS